MNSGIFIEPVLTNNFNHRYAHLDEAAVAILLCEAIQQLPGGTTKVLCLIGGAASGKSTLARLLIVALAKSGMTADTIGTDDFNRGDRAWRWKHFEGRDTTDQLDAPELKDFDLLNQKVNAIQQNTDPDRTIGVPTYNPATGLAIDEGEENYAHHIGLIDVLIVEGDFDPVEAPDLIVYLHVSDEQRLQNRIDRDAIHRNGNREQTIASFNFRQQHQHVPYTLPVAKKADILLDVQTTGGTWRYDVYQTKAIQRKARV
ncbi:MAG TPA: hypothetical protein VLH38_02905 [Patescibacteria group bacterium]|nr:hypothetical protein [Patescibacteria group bacterium]